MNRSQHIIRTQRIEIDFPAEMETNNAPHLIAEVFSERILPQVERLFDKHGGAQDLISIDKLEIDCGALESKAWEDRLVEIILDHLEERLTVEGRKGSPFDVTASAQRAWTHFLRQGYLSWDSPITSVTAFEATLSVDETLIFQLLEAIRQSPIVLNRLLHSFSGRFRAQLLAEAVKYAKDRYLDALLNVLPNAWREERWLQRALFGALVEIDKTSVSITADMDDTLPIYAIHLLSTVSAYQQSRVCQAIGAVYAQQGGTLGAPFFYAYGSSTAIEVLGKAIARHSDTAAHRWRAELAQFKRNMPPTVRTNEDEDRAKRGINDQGERRKTMRSREMDAGVDDDMIIVENAGLVLLHPFLNPLLETLEWVERGVFKSPEYAGSAALLMQYMACGDEPVDEAMLPLNKILCGLTPEHFVDVTNVPSATVKQEALAMLEAVVGHWKALKNTRVDGLRETFLRRTGNLQRNADGWTLQVEAKSLDILLNRLPWGISVVKLPWNRGLLNVSWI